MTDVGGFGLILQYQGDDGRRNEPAVSASTHSFSRKAFDT